GQDVAIGAALERVGPPAAEQDVTPRAAGQRIVAVAAAQDRGAAAAGQAVGAVAAEEQGREREARRHADGGGTAEAADDDVPGDGAQVEAAADGAVARDLHVGRVARHGVDGDGVAGQGAAHQQVAALEAGEHREELDGADVGGPVPGGTALVGGR